jgi:hypothetical protein
LIFLSGLGANFEEFGEDKINSVLSTSKDITNEGIS